MSGCEVCCEPAVEPELEGDAAAVAVASMEGRIVASDIPAGFSLNTCWPAACAAAAAHA